jgi:hypothetical protein
VVRESLGLSQVQWRICKKTTLSLHCQGKIIRRKTKKNKKKLVDYYFLYVYAGLSFGINTENHIHLQKGPCRFRNSMVGAQVSTYGYVQSNNPAAMQSALQRYGPIAVAITVVQSFYSYA